MKSPWYYAKLTGIHLAALLIVLIGSPKHKKRCKTCKHYVAGHLNLKYCSHPLIGGNEDDKQKVPPSNGIMVATYEEWTLHPGPEFGCVQWTAQ